MKLLLNIDYALSLYVYQWHKLSERCQLKGIYGWHSFNKCRNEAIFVDMECPLFDVTSWVNYKLIGRCHNSFYFYGLIFKSRTASLNVDHRFIFIVMFIMNQSTKKLSPLMFRESNDIDRKSSKFKGLWDLSEKMCS